MKLTALLSLCLIALCLLPPLGAGQTGDDVTISLQVPYYLGKPREGVGPGSQLQALYSIENRSQAAVAATISIKLPPGFALADRSTVWQVEQYPEGDILQRHIDLAGGYSQWFDLLTIQAAADIIPGTYAIIISDGRQTRQVPVTVVTTGRKLGNEPPVIEEIILPLDRDGKNDERLSRNTLVMRDKSWDYYKNIINGKGASNLEVEALHPLTHMRLIVKNPSEQQKLVVITARLHDAHSREPVSGLFTPGTTGEDKDAGSLGGHEDKLVAFAALTGEPRQTVQLPVYMNEQALAGGQYILRVVMEDEFAPPVVQETVITVVKKDWKALAVIGGAAVILLAALLLAVRRVRSVLATLKTRWLVTVALFGAAAFAVVTVPSTLLNDFFHILMGPFGFLVTGLFHSIMLYMMIIALVILIPRPGVIALMIIVRLLLGMLAFGQVSPISLLSYGINALLLETLLYSSGLYSHLQSTDAAAGLNWQKVACLALICGVADSIATYVTLQGLSVLYRMYYADWYIYLLLLINGFLYTAIGAVCGVRLGSRLCRVGGD
ncbi:MptD family putative ECF transporter S component [Sporomusa termitida]|uniref:Uncharacterized protein n=1 Tax=Sporomusa termitida TaxID=2377 RepID=A0A517DP23_9FIRM|nr:MptD family putative ECF transporter S component [Sporomusa termitida]QDR79102.1 hypothetical protein SPTER_03610 [Sporomusa termitida]